MLLFDIWEKPTWLKITPYPGYELLLSLKKGSAEEYD
jgi:hypothetical protein